MNLNFPFVPIIVRELNQYGRRTSNKTPEDMMKVRNLGRKSLEEVLAKLKNSILS